MSIKSNVPGIHLKYCPHSNINAMMIAQNSNTFIVLMYRCISSRDKNQAPSG